MKICEEHHIRESRQGVGPCNVVAEVRKRNGKPHWWCMTHGMPAAAPDGLPLTRCAGAWFEPVPEEMRLELDLSNSEVAIWGVVPAAVQIGQPDVEQGRVHVHRRKTATSTKDIDTSFDIVDVKHGAFRLTIEGIAAAAFSISELCGVKLTSLTCPHCGELHIDELKFATLAHRKHQCNSCGRTFWDTSGPSIGNPLANAYDVLQIPHPPKPARIRRPINLNQNEYSAIELWPSNMAIISTMSRPEEIGVHVHAYSLGGELAIDDTYSPVVLDGSAIDEDALRRLSVQRALAGDSPIMAQLCGQCGASMTSPVEGWIEPKTQHPCPACGAIGRTSRRVFINPLANLSDK
jgi:predicted RNA-binding Zn-ribbon protein involved in translation (DUF1610 family)